MERESKWNMIMIVFILLWGLTIVITVGVLLANLGFFGESELVTNFATWGQIEVLAMIIGTTLTITRGIVNKDKKFELSLSFENTDSADVRLDAHACTYEMLDMDSKRIDGGNLTPTRPGQGWQVVLPEKVWQSEYVLLKLQEVGGRKWRVGPFRPFEQLQTAEEV